MWQIWIDTGGTFTDCLALDPNGKLQQLKLLSSGVIRGRLSKQNGQTIYAEISWPTKVDIFKGYTLRDLDTDETYQIISTDTNSGRIELDRAFNSSASSAIEITAHETVPLFIARILTDTPLNQELPELSMRLGTTKGTNALLENKGAPVALLVTEGFKDILEIGTQQRPDIFTLDIQTPPMLYKSVLEISERKSMEGKTLKNLNIQEQELQRLIGADHSVAISLVNSYKNNEHEIELGNYLQNAGASHVSIGSDLSAAIKYLPRTSTAVVNAYLKPIMHDYLSTLKTKLIKGHLSIMTSGASIIPLEEFEPKDALLSGPAGGVLGAAAVAKMKGISRFISFDMGGTSTDISIHDNAISYDYETKVGNASIQSASVSIDTIAAGGGSICLVKQGILQVGPESAGADPGPACYGKAGPLTITDINLLAGKISESNFSIPLSNQHSEKALTGIKSQLDKAISNEALIESYTRLANEKMASAISQLATKKGVNVQELALITFGGAGGQHACDLAELLQVNKIIIPYEAGVLSALGIGSASYDQVIQKTLLSDLNAFYKEQDSLWEELYQKAADKYRKHDQDVGKTQIKHKFVYIRFKGQEHCLELDLIKTDAIEDVFKSEYTALYGHWVENKELEVESIKLITTIPSSSFMESNVPKDGCNEMSIGIQPCLINGSKVNAKLYKWESLAVGTTFSGPAIVSSNNCTVFVKPGWGFQLDENNIATLEVEQKQEVDMKLPLSATRSLFQNRFMNVVKEMGATLERTAFSVNIRDRLDFSCALLDDQGYLIVNAPHIPVHLGSMGICVRKVLAHCPIQEGDIIITNHPKYGGSHLPDVTLIAGVFHDHELIGYVANRAHHAEIGGITPGSMPTNATKLEEEGVIIEPTYLIKGGESKLDKVRDIFLNATYPTRNISENMADIEGALASIYTGIRGIQRLCSDHGHKEVKVNMEAIKTHSSRLIESKLEELGHLDLEAEEKLDDERILKVKIYTDNNFLNFDFSGTGPVDEGNLNATEAIVNSVVLYVLRLLINEDVPLNEGLSEFVNITLPHCLLNPTFDHVHMPAVVGGNTEISQRLTDTLLKAFELAACSQGTMNNLLFGNNDFGYYETIGGGSGAGPGFNGHDGIHQHMTNTKITDVEIMEFKYPVTLDKFAIRPNSGGAGKFDGGNGLIRKFTFNQNLTVTLLAQHRKYAPYGMHGGQSGSCGKQTLLRSNGSTTEITGKETIKVNPGDSLVIETPGGGGYGLSH